MDKIYKLPPYGSNQRSFYGKAIVVEENGVKFLQSYYTIVAAFDGKFHRLWGGWSATTSKHVNSFCCMLGLGSMPKAKWGKLPVERYESVRNAARLEVDF